MSVTVVIAPDSFKGSASAHVVAESIAQGWESARPADRVLRAPMADGGEGTLEILHSTLGGTRHPVRVLGPLDREVDADWLLLPDGTAVVELASTSGIALVDGPLSPFAAHTYGFGQAIAAALDAHPRRLLLALGGSASTDGGAGALAALGARPTDAAGRPVALGNQGLHDLAVLDLTGLPSLPADGVLLLNDVTNPLLGPEGAARVFGPQKGADGPDATARLEAGLANLAAILGRGDSVGAGAAGGTAYGMLAWGATRTAGAVALGEVLGLPRLIAEADVVVTGEGRFDSQTASGKVASHVAELADASGAERLLVAGAIEADTRGFRIAMSLAEAAGGAAPAMADTAYWARIVGSRLGRLYGRMREAA